MAVSYEWCREYMDHHGDILHLEHSDKLIDLKTTLDVKDAVITRVALIRNEGNDEDGLQERDYAYSEAGMIEIHTFETGYKVPAKYIKEFRSWHTHCHPQLICELALAI